MHCFLVFFLLLASLATADEHVVVKSGDVHLEGTLVVAPDGNYTVTVADANDGQVEVVFTIYPSNLEFSYGKFQKRAAKKTPFTVWMEVAANRLAKFTAFFGDHFHKIRNLPYCDLAKLVPDGPAGYQAANYDAIARYLGEQGVLSEGLGKGPVRNKDGEAKFFSARNWANTIEFAANQELFADTVRIVHDIRHYSLTGVVTTGSVEAATAGALHCAMRVMVAWEDRRLAALEREGNERWSHRRGMPSTPY